METVFNLCVVLSEMLFEKCFEYYQPNPLLNVSKALEIKAKLKGFTYRKK